MRSLPSQRKGGGKRFARPRFGRGIFRNPAPLEIIADRGADSPRRPSASGEPEEAQGKPGRRPPTMATSTAASSSHPSVFEEQRGVDMMGSASRYFSLVKVYSEKTLPEAIEAIVRYHRQADFVRLHQMAHQLKGISLFVACPGIVGVCTQMTAACPRGMPILCAWQRELTTELVEELLLEHRRVRTYFNKQYTDLKCSYFDKYMPGELRW